LRFGLVGFGLVGVGLIGVERGLGVMQSGWTQGCRPGLWWGVRGGTAEVRARQRVAVARGGILARGRNQCSKRVAQGDSLCPHRLLAGATRGGRRYGRESILR